MSENTTVNKSSKPPMKSLGGLYKKESAKGVKYYKGFVENGEGSRTKIIVFANREKKNENSPDLTIYLDEPLEGSAPTPKTAPKTEAVKKFNATLSKPSQFKAHAPKGDNDEPSFEQSAQVEDDGGLI